MFDNLVARRAGAVLALLVLVVAALAGSLSGTTRGTAVLRGGASSIALSVAVTLGGLVVLAAAAVFAYAMASSPIGSSLDMSRERRSFWRAAAAVLILVAFGGLAVLVLAHRRAAHHLTVAAATPSLAHHGAAAHSNVHFLPSASAATIGAVALLAAGFLVAAWLRAHRRGQRWNLAEILANRTPARSAIPPVAPLLAESLTTVRVADPEEEADPRKAVVAAYLAMNRVAGSFASAERRSDETPSEYLGRLLSFLGSSLEGARRLTSLFETARYSTKPFGEASRSQAIAALRQVQRELAGAGLAGAGRAAPGRVG